MTADPKAAARSRGGAGPRGAAGARAARDPAAGHGARGPDGPGPAPRGAHELVAPPPRARSTLRPLG